MQRNFRRSSGGKWLRLSHRLQRFPLRLVCQARVPGPQQQPQPTQLVGSAQSGLLQQQQQDFDPVQRYKMLIPQLKESLQVMGPARGARGAGWRAGGLRGRAPRGCLLKERS